MREMKKNNSPVVVLQIQPKFWWMLRMGVRDNHTKYEPQTQQSQPRAAVASTGDPFPNLLFGPNPAFFLFTKAALEVAKNGQNKGYSGYPTRATRLPRAKGPSKAL